MMVHSGRVFAQGATADCEVSSRVALRIGFDEATSKALLHAFARWDGQGVPHGVSGDDVVRPARIVHIASFAELRHRAGGANAAIEAVARGAGGWFDPQIVSEFTKTGEDMLSTLEGDSIWDVALEAEPRPRRYASDEDIDKLALAFADLVDLKSSYRLGHSQGVAQLVERACRVLGMPDRAVVDARRAALLHDLGMYSVPTSILDKAGKLTASEQERVRMHAYHTERVLARSALLADIATLASMHHERLDGKGYHRAAPASIVPMAARVLAAADAFQAMTQSRPYRAGLTRDAAAKELTAQALGGGLDRQAARAVCDAAGAQTKIPRGSCGPQGLSEREIEVLRLLARGHSKKQIGKALFIASGTVHTHVTHIYEKIGVSSRAAAALFAMEQGLLP
jgi:HD-GYP domain-containing protein (c-di-GMP phosphodiesterase class II)